MNRVLLITGASRGIGAATAKLAATQGYSICVNYRSDENSARVIVDECRKYDVRAIAVKADISSENEVIDLFKTVDRELGPLIALVNNAGILEAQTTVASMTLQRLQQVFAVNVFGSILCSREAIKRMSTKFGGRGGGIVNVSSAASRLGSAGEYVDYASSKGAIDSFTIGLSKEVAAEGIRVNAVRPGFIETDIHASGGEPGRIERVKSAIPLGRGGRPEEVAHAILWLLSDQASFITGSFIDIAGGK